MSWGYRSHSREIEIEDKARKVLARSLLPSLSPPPPPLSHCFTFSLSLPLSLPHSFSFRPALFVLFVLILHCWDVSTFSFSCKPKKLPIYLSICQSTYLLDFMTFLLYAYLNVHLSIENKIKMSQVELNSMSPPPPPPPRKKILIMQ